MILILCPVHRYKFGSPWWALVMVSVVLLSAMPKNSLELSPGFAHAQVCARCSPRVSLN